jgi:hypothetical protein
LSALPQWSLTASTAGRIGERTAGIVEKTGAIGVNPR